MSTNFNVNGTDLDQLYLTNAAAGWQTPSTGFTQVWGNSAGIANGYNFQSGLTVPMSFYPANTWKSIVCGSYNYNTAYAIKMDGTLWVCGQNNFGMLGTGDIVNRGFFTKIGAFTDYVQVSSMNDFALLLRSNGTLWGMGVNTNGQLGDGTSIPKSSPVQVGSGSTWTSVSAGMRASYAIKADGTLWSWGSNQVGGALGDGNSTSAFNRSSPGQIGSLNTWRTVSAGADGALATKTDGTLWVWGTNGNGTIGDGTLVSKSTPVQVGSLTNWQQVIYANNCVTAIKTDGTLWTWGYAGYGQLGNNLLTPDRLSPAQVGALTDWLALHTQGGVSNNIMATKTDGTLWVWGNMPYGNLTATPRSSPVQVGSLNTWAPPIASGRGVAYATYKKS